MNPIATEAAASKKQPGGLYVLFMTELWERYGFYIVSGLLVLFMSKHLGMKDDSAYMLFGIVQALLFVSPTVGGFLADRFLGYHTSLTLGAILLAIGYSLLASPNIHYFYYALAFLIVGMGFFKFAPSTLLGKLYKNHDSRVDSGYTIFYMGINIGSFASFISSGYIARAFGWNVPFIAAAAGVALGLATFYIAKRKLDGTDNQEMIKKMTFPKLLGWLAGIAVTIVGLAYVIQHSMLSHLLVIGIIVALLGYLGTQFKTLTQKERRGIILAVILIAVAVIFFTLYFQQPMSMTLFTDRNVTKHFLGLNIPTATFQSLNPLWIMVLSPFLAKFYVHMGKKDISLALKFGIGTVIMGLAYLLLSFGTHFANAASHISAWWLVASYGMQSTAELLVSALGLSVIAKYAPKKLLGVMMGGWFLSTAAAGLLAGQVARLSDVPKNMAANLTLPIYGHTFLEFGLAALAIGVVVVLFAKKIMSIAEVDSELESKSQDEGLLPSEA